MAENYRALTRTYRPRTFDDIVSQEHVSSTLKNAIKQNRLAHAYMFCGPRGVGKTTMARVLARAVNQIDAEVDGESLNQTLNVIEIDAASNNSVEDVRDLRERVRIPPQNGRYKIYIIDEVHMLSKSAFNALLKTLEEPPEHVIFIFATTEPHKVLPTILSRVQRFDFKRIKVEEIVARLREISDREGINIDDESLHVIAKKADGALRDALGLMDQAIAFCGMDINHDELLRALNVVSTERMFDLMKAVQQHDADSGLSQVNDLLQEGYDIQEFLTGLTEHLRNLYIAKSSKNMHLVEASEDTKKRYIQSAQNYSQDDMMRMLHIVSEAQYKIKEAHQPRIQFEITLLKLIHMQRSETLQHLIEGLEALKKKFENGEPVKKQEQPESDTSETSPEPQSQEKVTTEPDEQKADAPTSAPSTSTAPNASPSNGVSEPQTREPEKQGQDAVAPQNAPEQPADEPRAELNKPDSTDANDASSSAYDFFGKPSLNKFADKKAPNQQQDQQAQTHVAVQDRSEEESSPYNGQQAPKKLHLSELKEMWPQFVESVREDVPQMLYYQLQRIDPVKLKNNELVLRCSDDFAKKMVEENQRQVGQYLKRYTGTFLRINCAVRQQAKQKKQSMSPYERFKKLQEKDPTIRTIVEMFGAELEY